MEKDSQRSSQQLSPEELNPLVQGNELQNQKTKRKQGSSKKKEKYPYQYTPVGDLERQFLFEGQKKEKYKSLANRTFIQTETLSQGRLENEISGLHILKSEDGVENLFIVTGNFIIKLPKNADSFKSIDKSMKLKDAVKFSAQCNSKAFGVLSSECEFHLIDSHPEVKQSIQLPKRDNYSGICINKSLSILVVTSQHGSLSFYDLRNGEEMQVIPSAHAKKIRCSVSGDFLEQKGFLMTGSSDGVVKAWDLASLRLEPAVALAQNSEMKKRGMKGQKNASEKEDPRKRMELLSIKPNGFPVMAICIYMKKFGLISTEKQKRIYLLDLERKKIIRHFEEEESQCISIMAPFGAYFVAVDLNSNIFVIDFEKNEKIWSRKSQAGLVSCVLIDQTDKQLITGGFSKMIRFFNLKSGKVTKCLPKTHMGPIQECVIRGEFVLTGSSDRSVKLWFLHKKKYLNEYFDIHDSEITALEFSVASNYFFSASSSDNSIKKWNIDTGQCIGIMEDAHQSEIVGLRAVSSDDLVSISKDSIKLWSLDLALKQKIQKPFGADSISKYYFNFKRDLLAVSSNKSALMVWEVPSLVFKNEIEILDSEVVTFTMSEEMEMLFVSLKNKTVRQISMASRQVLFVWEDVSKNGCLAMAVDKKGAYMVVATDENHLKVFSVASRKNIKTFSGQHDKKINKVVFSDDSRFLVSCSADSTVKVVDLQNTLCTCRVTSTDHMKTRSFTAVGMDPNGEYVLAATEQKTLICFDLEDFLVQRSQESYHDENFPISFVLVLRQEDYVVGVSISGNYLKSWKLPEISQVSEASDSNGTNIIAAAVVYPESGKSPALVTSARDMKIKMWDGPTLVLIRTIDDAHKGFVFRIESYKDMFISACNTKCLKLWSAKDGSEVHCFQTGGNNTVSISAMALHSDLVTFSTEDSQLHLCSIKTKEEIFCKNLKSRAITLGFIANGRLIMANISHYFSFIVLDVKSQVTVFSIKQFTNARAFSLMVSTTQPIAASASSEDIVFVSFDRFVKAPGRNLEGPKHNEISFIMDDSEPSKLMDYSCEELLSFNYSEELCFFSLILLRQLLLVTGIISPTPILSRISDESIQQLVFYLVTRKQKQLRAYIESEKFSEYEFYIWLGILRKLNLNDELIMIAKVLFSSTFHYSISHPMELLLKLSPHKAIKYASTRFWFVFFKNFFSKKTEKSNSFILVDSQNLSRKFIKSQVDWENPSFFSMRKQLQGDVSQSERPKIPVELYQSKLPIFQDEVYNRDFIHFMDICGSTSWNALMTDPNIEVMINHYWSRFRAIGVVYLFIFTLFLITLYILGFYMTGPDLRADPVFRLLAVLTTVIVLFLFLYEFLQFLSSHSKWSYFFDIRNAFDLAHILYILFFTWISFFYKTGEDSEMIRDIYIIGLFLSFLKHFLLLQNIDSIRSLTNQLINTFKSMGPFFLLLVLCLSCFSIIFYSSHYLGEDMSFIEILKFTFNAFFANWDDFYIVNGIVFFFLFLTVFFTIVLFNVLIAIIDNSYQESCAAIRESDNREKLRLTLEYIRMERIIRRVFCLGRKESPPNNTYLYVYRRISNDSEDGVTGEEEWFGKINALANEISTIQNKVVSEMVEKVEKKSGEMGKVLERIEMNVFSLQQSRIMLSTKVKGLKQRRNNQMDESESNENYEIKEEEAEERSSPKRAEMSRFKKKKTGKNEGSEDNSKDSKKIIKEESIKSMKAKEEINGSQNGKDNGSRNGKGNGSRDEAMDKTMPFGFMIPNSGSFDRENIQIKGSSAEDEEHHEQEHASKIFEQPLPPVWQPDNDERAFNQ